MKAKECVVTMSYFSRYLSRDYQRGIQTGSTRKTNNAIELQVISENNGLFTKLFSFIFGHVIIAVWKERVTGWSKTYKQTQISGTEMKQRN